MRLLDGMPYVHSSGTRVSDTMRAHGFKGPEALAAEAEHAARIEGALICMKRIQSQSEQARKVTSIDKARNAKRN